MAERKNIRVEFNYEELLLLRESLCEDKDDLKGFDPRFAELFDKLEAARAKLNPERYKREHGL